MQTSDQIWELDQLNEQLKIDKQKLMGELVRADDQLAEAEQIEERLKSVSSVRLLFFHHRNNF